MTLLAPPDFDTAVSSIRLRTSKCALSSDEDAEEDEAVIEAEEASEASEASKLTLTPQLMHRVEASSESTGREKRARGMIS